MVANRRRACELGQVVRPLDAVAAYIPSGRYPLPSTLMMTVIPAQVAGVPRICVASPRAVPRSSAPRRMLGRDATCSRWAARTRSRRSLTAPRRCRRSDRIVGPGNIYVAAAKKLLAGEVGIDFVAGPTEILIIAADGDPRVIAADMLAQAEHDVEASAVLLTTSKSLAEAVAKEVERQLATLPTARCRARRRSTRTAPSFWSSTRSTRRWRLSNRFAPEHLSIPSAHCWTGCGTPAAFSSARTARKPRAITPPDPTMCCRRPARRACAAGFRLLDFVKVISVQELSRGRA